MGTHSLIPHGWNKALFGGVVTALLLLALVAGGLVLAFDVKIGEVPASPTPNERMFESSSELSFGTWQDPETGGSYFVSTLENGATLYNAIPSLRYRADGTPDCPETPRAEK